MFSKKSSFAIILLLIFLVGCAGAPVRPLLKENLSIPSGKIEGNQFTGIRYPFNVSAPPQWTMTTQFPDFMQELGYDKPSPTDQEQTELYIFNPLTQSNLQFDFSPANPHFVASQEVMEALVNMGASSLKDEWEKEGVRVQVGPTETVTLKGVQYAAKKYVTYTVKGVKREQGWIYGFTEPYQIFILYMIIGKEGTNDRQDMKSILNSFEVLMPKKQSLEEKGEKGMATKPKVKAKVYKCATCGLVTTERGHLCRPKEVKKAYTCEYCGLTVSDPRHVCKPKVAKLNYVCDACGRVAVGKEDVCQPKKIKS